MTIALTGDRPTGPLHLGHYVGSLQNRLTMQDTYDQYIMIADVQALTDNFENPKKVTENVFELMKDYLAIGLDPSKNMFFIQSQIPEVAELTIYYLNLVTVARLERNPTVKTEIGQKGYDDSIPAGFLCYPVSQAADITIVQAEIVPVGEDQLPMIEQTNEIVRRFNRIYNVTCLKECKPLLGKTTRLVGIDGKAKAGKSLGNAIYLSDSAEEIKRKVFSMFTDPTHLKISDPGQIEGNVVFAYLDAFHADKEEVSALKEHYQKGGLGDTTIKALLNTTLQTLLEPIRDTRSRVQLSDMRDILQTGTQKTRQTAMNTMEQVRQAIGLKYF
jgi:tryptophanyl-tRNA synthetase